MYPDFPGYGVGQGGLPRGGGRGRAWGGGRGWISRSYTPGFYPPPASSVPYAVDPAFGQQDELEALRNQAEALTSQLEAIDTRINQLQEQKK